jgi:glycosyltransferase involved in cell wall biosynthesis
MAFPKALPQKPVNFARAIIDHMKLPDVSTFDAAHRPIAFVSTMEGAPWGGSEELWSRVAVRLKATGRRVVANIVHWPQEAPAISAMRTHGVDVSTRPRLDSLRNRVLKRLRGEFARGWLSRVRPRLLIISQGGNLDGLVWMEHAAQMQIPFVTIAQMANDSYWPPADLGDRAAAVYPLAEQCFFVSKGNRDLTEMQIACRLPRSSVVRNPVNISSNLSLPLPWPSHEDGIFRLAVVGRLAPCAKGQDIILQVLATAKWRNRPVHVSLFGDGFFRKSMERLVKMMNLEMVHFAGHVTQIDQVWSTHHALLMASRYEGLPLALVEAMLCGRVPIVTDVAGNAEMVTDDVTGFVAEAPKPACLNEAMERAWNARNRWREMGLAAAAKVRQLLPEDPIADFIQRLPLPFGSPMVVDPSPGIASVTAARCIESLPPSLNRI